MEKPILDVACGSKMFWFDKNNPHVEFCDNRTVSRHEYYPGRYIEIGAICCGAVSKNVFACCAKTVF